jgi:hypothetical protein
MLAYILFVLLIRSKKLLPQLLVDKLMIAITAALAMNLVMNATCC